MLFSLFVGVIAFTLLYVWLVLHRSRTMAMEDMLEDRGLDEAIADARGRRRRERGDLAMETPGSSSAATSSRSPSSARWRGASLRRRSPVGAACRRRRQVLDLSRRPMTDLEPRTAARLGRARRQPVRRRLDRRSSCSCVVLVAGGVIVTQVPRARRSTTTATSTRSATGAAATPIAACASRAPSTKARSVDDGGDTDFVIAFNGVTVPVRYDGEPGGIFKECIPVVVHGSSSTASGVFEGDRVEVKHSDEYVAVNDDRLSEADDWPLLRGGELLTADARRSLNGALGHAGLLLVLCASCIGALSTGLGDRQRRSPLRTPGLALRVADRWRRRARGRRRWSARSSPTTSR